VVGPTDVTAEFLFDETDKLRAYQNVHVTANGTKLISHFCVDPPLLAKFLSPRRAISELVYTGLVLGYIFNGILEFNGRAQFGENGVKTSVRSLCVLELVDRGERMSAEEGFTSSFPFSFTVCPD
jgi:hypothetical protein